MADRRDGPADAPILQAENLTKHFETSDGVIDSLLGRSRTVRAVDGVDLALRSGETLAVVGESGCGKTTLARALVHLTEPTAGSVCYRGEDLTACSEDRRRSLRTELQYVFQDPSGSLDPRQPVREIVGEPLDVHDLASGAARTERVLDLLDAVGLSPAHADRYPHALSGGQRRRVGIARALAVDPDVLVCDEPVADLDVSVQARVLNLLADLQEDRDIAFVLVAHDLRVVDHLADRVAVMYLGEVVERGPTRAVFEPPFHPYTEALVSAVPEPDPAWEGERIRLPGEVPSPADPPDGCRFHTRCPRVVQPSDVDVAQAAWRSLLRFRDRVTTAEDLAAVTAGLPDRDAATTGPTDAALSRAAFGRRVRERFEIPDPVRDDAVEATVTAAIDRLHDDDLAAATERIATLETPCERQPPDDVALTDEHRVACVRFDDRRPGAPPSTDG